MKKNKTSQIIIWAAAFILAGFTSLIALADTVTQNNLAKVATGTNSSFGKFYATARMTNSTGSYWIKPPTNIVVTSGTLTDMSGFPTPYSSYALVTPFGSSSNLCAPNSITFPATNSLEYELNVFVTSPTPPPTNTQPMVLQITWSTNQ